MEEARIPVDPKQLGKSRDSHAPSPLVSVSKLTRALNVKANDLHMVVYVSSLVRAVLSLHDLLHNKLVMLEHKKKEAKEAKEKEMEKAKQKEKGEKKSEEEKKK